jgi:hypothetical protein
MTDYAGYGIPEQTPSGSIIPAAGPPTAGNLLTKAQAEAILKSQGTWVVYVRRHLDFPCTKCSSAQLADGAGNCPECLGTGYKATLERRQVLLARGRRMFGYETDFPAGYIPDTKNRAYFTLPSGAKARDMILEVVWDTATPSEFSGEPVQLLHVYSLEQCDIMYFDRQPAYYMCVLDSFDHKLSPVDTAVKARRR